MRYRFDGWEFDATSGELRRGDDAPTRLQPQPAQLFDLLLRRAGQVVTREEIVQTVWPDTKVEFDQVVNYSVRHLRSALGDTAADGRYIETLPRRGYRFRVPVESLGPVPIIPSRSARGVRAGATLLVVGLLLVGWGGVRDRGDNAQFVEDAPLVAVLTLRHDTSDPSAAEAARRVAERLTTELTQRAGVRGRVVGPRTTDQYQSGERVLQRLVDATGADYVMSGSIDPDAGDGAFFEFIRTLDGAHIWAMRGDPTDNDALLVAIDSVVARLGW